MNNLDYFGKTSYKIDIVFSTLEGDGIVGDNFLYLQRSIIGIIQNVKFAIN